MDASFNKSCWILSYVRIWWTKKFGPPGCTLSLPTINFPSILPISPFHELPFPTSFHHRVLHLLGRPIHRSLHPEPCSQLVSFQSYLYLPLNGIIRVPVSQLLSQSITVSPAAWLANPLRLPPDSATQRKQKQKQKNTATQGNKNKNKKIKRNRKFAVPNLILFSIFFRKKRVIIIYK